jgi:S-adenosylmethionine-diacylgycerolhomoserine-N-methlytransferase
MNENKLKDYYRAHALIYDATRWTFLFGRHRVLRKLAVHCPNPSHILEVGCGTGKNLEQLCHIYPQATITGLDMSEDMLRIARKKLSCCSSRIRWKLQCYEKPTSNGNPYDLILFSYSLSMFNPGWMEALAAAFDDLSEHGCIAVVDFHSTRLSWFRKWMRLNHVRMEGHLLPFLATRSRSLFQIVSPAYGGCWDYFIFLGLKTA